MELDIKKTNYLHIPLIEEYSALEELVRIFGSARGIMLPIFQTSKTIFLISPHYDAFGNDFSPFGDKLLAA